VGSVMRFRLLSVAITSVALLLTLVARLWYLQGIESPRYETLAAQNSIRQVYIPAPRGRILDRFGRVLVGNRSAYAIVVKPDELSKSDQRREVLERLAALLTTASVQVSAGDLEERISVASSGIDSVVVAEDVPREKVIFLLEHRDQFPGVDAEVRAVREYTLGPGGGGPLAPHVLGYVAPVTKEILEADPTYNLADKVGRGGVEQQYDKLLRGAPGYRKLEVTARGKVVRELEFKAPVAGSDVYLTLDLEVQRVAEEALAQVSGGLEGLYDPISGPSGKRKGAAAVVLDPKTGGILAMASYPAFDLRLLQSGLSVEQWEKFNDPSNHFPLQNRAVQGQYPPASTIKPIVAAAAWKEGMITPETTFACPGKYQVPGDVSGAVFKDWTPYGHGYPDLAKAIAQSCDVYFYNLGWLFYQRYRLEGRDVMQDDLREFGLGALTGVDLPGEQPGRVPDPAWKLKVNDNDPTRENARWYPGDNVNMSIGQGDLLATPLQLAQAYAGLVNGGVMNKPHVFQKATSPSGEVVASSAPEPRRAAELDSQALSTLTSYLEGVVRGGTAAKAFAGWPFQTQRIGGKTGTAEIHGKKDNSLFVGVGPLDDPRWVVAVVVEGGGHGSQTAAPVARRIMETLASIAPSDLSQVVASASGGGGD
jgi:penicillin-binding protein 2